MPRSAKSSLTVRLPGGLYETVCDLARRREISLNKLIQQALTEVVERDRQQEMYNAFTVLGQDRRGCDVDFAFQAQREVVISQARAGCGDGATGDLI